MQKFAIFSLLLFSVPTLAEQIQLSAGSHINIGDNEISCVGNESAKECLLTRDSSGYYEIGIGRGNPIKKFSYLESAIDKLKELRDSGFCN